MNVFVLLDILLLILIALFVPIGFWRGAQREVLVSLGILFGAALSDTWAVPLGHDLAGLTSLRESGGAFVVSVLFLVGSTFLLGYGSGAALPVPRPGLWSRFFGALIAGGNGALLLSYALRDIRVYLLANQAPGFLNRSLVAQFLSTGIGWLLLVATVIFLPIVIVLALFGRDVVPEAIEGDEPYGEYPEPVVRAYPPRVPPANGIVAPTATYKAEPPQGSLPRPTEQTRPLRIQPADDTSAQRGGQYLRSGNDADTAVTRITGDVDPQKTIQLQVGESQQNGSPVQDGTCPSCHADVRGAEVYCPRCGRVL
ncbi:MAG TPA: CvpA family protein [Thermomicrobiaceae bacterium]|nr:CvpA family protein [Thermomicrobiaceae bacterium]